MCLGSQRASLYKEGLGYVPKKGKASFAPHKTSFVKKNGRFCTSCKQIGHKEHECKNKSKNANVSSMKINSFYVLTKGTNGVKAKCNNPKIHTPKIPTTNFFLELPCDDECHVQKPNLRDALGLTPT